LIGRFADHIALDDGTGVVDCVVFTHTIGGTPKADVPDLHLGRMVQLLGNVRRAPWLSHDPGRPAWEVSARTVRQVQGYDELMAAWATTMRLWIDEYCRPAAELAPALPVHAVLPDLSCPPQEPTAASLPQLKAATTPHRKVAQEFESASSRTDMGKAPCLLPGAQGSSTSVEAASRLLLQSPAASQQHAGYTLQELQDMSLSQLTTALWLSLKQPDQEGSRAPAAAPPAPPSSKRSRGGASIQGNTGQGAGQVAQSAIVTAHSTLVSLLDPAFARAQETAAGGAARLAVLFPILSVLHEMANAGELLLCSGNTAPAAAAPSQFTHDDLECGFMRVSVQRHLVPALLHAAVSIMWPAAALQLQECTRSAASGESLAAARQLAVHAVQVSWSDSGIATDCAGADDIAAKAQQLWGVAQHAPRASLKKALRELEGEGWLIQFKPGEYGPVDWDTTLTALAKLLPGAMATASEAGFM